MLKFFTAILLFLLMNLNAFSQNDIFFNFDYSIFKGEDEKFILEIYYSVNQHSLLYTQNGNEYEGAALLDITITNTSDKSTVYSNLFKSPSIVTDTTKNNSKKLIGQVNYLLSEGKFNLQIKGSDFSDTLKYDSYEKEIIIGYQNPGGVSMSDIELASSITKSDNTKSPFYKNTLEIIPNPSALFGMNLHELNYYYEIYGLTESNISADFIINYSVYNLNNVKLISKDKKVKRKNESKADFGTVLIDSLDRGSYNFIVTISDTSKNIKLTKEKKFFIYQDNNTQNSTLASDDFLKSAYITKTEKELDDEFEKIIYIANPKFISRYEQLKNVNDKRELLYEFWKAQDSNPETQVLETRIAYFKRVDDANRLYKEAYVEGWKTDRGRIYIVYGKPDDVERHPFESETKSYEIWSYNSIEGGGECVFVEFNNSLNEYRLVHSTFRNELQNKNWRDLINKY